MDVTEISKQNEKLKSYIWVFKFVDTKNIKI